MDLRWIWGEERELELELELGGESSGSRGG